MTLKMKPKTFGPVFVDFDGDETVQFAYGDPTELSSSPPLNSPVDTLLASLGYCIVASIQWAAGERNLELNPFMVEISGIKALDQPGRVEKIDSMVIGQVVDDAGLSERILKQAKAICTVSNTLNCEVTLTSKN